MGRKCAYLDDFCEELVADLYIEAGRCMLINDSLARKALIVDTLMGCVARTIERMLRVDNKIDHDWDHERDWWVLSEKIWRRRKLSYPELWDLQLDKTTMTDLAEEIWALHCRIHSEDAQKSPDALMWYGFASLLWLFATDEVVMECLGERLGTQFYESARLLGKLAGLGLD